MFDYARTFKDDRNNIMVGRVVGGRRYPLYMVNVDWTYNGKEWCRDHGMKLVDRVMNTEGTAWYEIWATDDLHLMTAFII